jgi:hypothetical protein
MNGNGNGIHFATSTSLVSETHFVTPLDVQNLLYFLRNAKITGCIQIHLHQGGIQRVSLTEKSALDIK